LLAIPGYVAIGFGGTLLFVAVAPLNVGMLGDRNTSRWLRGLVALCLLFWVVVIAAVIRSDGMGPVH